MGSRGCRSEMKHSAGTGAGGDSPLCVEPACDAEEGWTCVELALAWVDEVVGGLTQGDVEELYGLDVDQPPPVSSSSRQLTDDDVDVRQDQAAVNGVDDDDARCCIADACNIL